MTQTRQQPDRAGDVRRSRLLTYLGPLVAIGTFLTALVMWAMMSPEQLDRLVTREGTPVENATVVLYFLVAACLLFWPSPPGKRRDAPLLVGSALISILFAMRELDVNKRLTSGSITKINYYLDPAVPLVERLIAAVVILLIIGAVLAYLVAYAPRLWRSVHNRSAAGISVLTVVVLIPVTKVVDRLPNRLREAGIMEVSGSTKRLSATFEEMLELALPVIMLIAFLQYRDMARRR